jgi:hypothetical protein
MSLNEILNRVPSKPSSGCEQPQLQGERQHQIVTIACRKVRISLGKAEIAEPKSNLQRSGSLYWPEAKHSGFLV